MMNEVSSFASLFLSRTSLPALGSTSTLTPDSQRTLATLLTSTSTLTPEFRRTQTSESTLTSISTMTSDSTLTSITNDISDDEISTDEESDFNLDNYTPDDYVHSSQPEKLPTLIHRKLIHNNIINDLFRKKCCSNQCTWSFSLNECIKFRKRLWEGSSQSQRQSRLSHILRDCSSNSNHLIPFN
jgi:hypothetical protein